MADILKPKRGSHAIISRINPLLEDGEIVFEYPEPSSRKLGLIKMGDGVHRYNELPTFLVNVTDYISVSEKGAANGIVPLNTSKKIDADYLPSYVDDVLEYPNKDVFPQPGEKGKIYVDISQTMNNMYRWSGTMYVCIGTSVRYTLTQNENKIMLKGTDDSVNTVDVTQICEYPALSEFPEHGEEGKIYVATNITYNNLYRWDGTRYVGCANSNSYSIEKVGSKIILRSSDGSDSSIDSEVQEYASTDAFPETGKTNTLYIDTSTTENNTYRWDGSDYVHITTSVKYTIAKNQNSLKLTGSDGSEISIDNDVLFYDSKSAFPETGEDYKLYVDKAKMNIYEWKNNAYSLISATYKLTKSGSTIKLTGSDGSETEVTDDNTTYSLSKSGSSIKLTGSDGSESSVSNVGGVEIRTTDPTAAELYAGKMWIKI